MSDWPQFTRLDESCEGPVQINPANVAYVQDDTTRGAIITTNAKFSMWVAESRAEVIDAMKEEGRELSAREDSLSTITSSVPIHGYEIGDLMSRVYERPRWQRWLSWVVWPWREPRKTTHMIVAGVSASEVLIGGKYRGGNG